MFTFLTKRSSLLWLSNSRLVSLNKDDMVLVEYEGSLLIKRLAC